MSPPTERWSHAPDARLDALEGPASVTPGSAWRRPTVRGSASSPAARTTTPARSGRRTARRSRSSATARRRAGSSSTRWRPAVLGEARLAHHRGRRGGAPPVVARWFDDPDGGGRDQRRAGRRAGLGHPGRSGPGAAPAPPWLPEVESSDDADERRALWLVDAGTGEARSIGRQDLNIWEASWCGNDLIVADRRHGRRRRRLVRRAARSRSTSRPAPTGSWHRATCSWGGRQGSPDGREVAVIEAVCSDRYVVAGQLLLVDPASGARRPIDTAGVDVSWSEWRRRRPVVRDRTARTRHRGPGGGHRIRRRS